MYRVDFHCVSGQLGLELREDRYSALATLEFSQTCLHAGVGIFDAWLTSALPSGMPDVFTLDRDHCIGGRLTVIRQGPRLLQSAMTPRYCPAEEHWPSTEGFAIRQVHGRNIWTACRERKCIYKFGTRAESIFTFILSGYAWTGYPKSLTINRASTAWDACESHFITKTLNNWESLVP